MRVQIDCYPCILGQLSELAKKAESGDEARHRLVRQMLRQVLEADESVTPPDFAALFHGEVARRTGIEDPYREAKDRSTELALELLPELRRLVEEHPDPFEAAVRLAIGGNIIDYGAIPDFNLNHAERRIREVFDLPLDLEAAAELRRRIDRADSILYILDNCGEAVLDRLLLERCAGKVTAAVRGKPILNDVTRREAALSGIDFVPLVDTGDNVPGVSLKTSSPEFLRLFHNADLVIAKGQGNYESLEHCDRPIFFLLRIKCGVLASRLGRPEGSLQIQGRNLDA